MKDNNHSYRFTIVKKTSKYRVRYISFNRRIFCLQSLHYFGKQQQIFMQRRNQPQLSLIPRWSRFCSCVVLVGNRIKYNLIHEKAMSICEVMWVFVVIWDEIYRISWLNYRGVLAVMNQTRHTYDIKLPNIIRLDNVAIK